MGVNDWWVTGNSIVHKNKNVQDKLHNSGSTGQNRRTEEYFQPSN
jgi:hypothetical protein